MKNLFVIIASLLIILFSFILFKQKFANTADPLKEFASVSSITLSGKDIKLENDTLLYGPYDFQVFDTLAIFNDNTGASGFTIINLKTGKLVKKFAFSGDSPSEFDINDLSMNSAVSDKSMFTLMQVNPPCKIFRYYWDSLLNNINYRPLPFYYTHKFTFSSAFSLNDSMLFGQISFSRFDDKMYGIVNTFSSKLITGGYLPRVADKNLSLYYDDSLCYKWLKVVLNGKICHRPDSKYEFAFFSMDGAVIQIFDIDKDYKFKIQFERAYYLPSFRLIKTPGFIKPVMNADDKLGFNDIAVTKDNIYSLFNGQRIKDIQNNDRRADVVLVYNWNGKPTQKIKLDRKCGRIFIDENNPKILYGLYGAMYTKIVKYKLP